MNYDTMTIKMAARKYAVYAVQTWYLRLVSMLFASHKPYSCKASLRFALLLCLVVEGVIGTWGV